MMLCTASMGRWQVCVALASSQSRGAQQGIPTGGCQAAASLNQLREGLSSGDPQPALECSLLTFQLSLPSPPPAPVLFPSLTPVCAGLSRPLLALVNLLINPVKRTSQVSLVNFVQTHQQHLVKPTCHSWSILVKPNNWTWSATPVKPGSTPLSGTLALMLLLSAPAETPSSTRARTLRILCSTAPQHTKSGPSPPHHPQQAWSASVASLKCVCANSHDKVYSGGQCLASAVQAAGGGGERAGGGGRGGRVCDKEGAGSFVLWGVITGRWVLVALLAMHCLQAGGWVTACQGWRRAPYCGFGKGPCAGSNSRILQG